MNSSNTDAINATEGLYDPVAIGNFFVRKSLDSGWCLDIIKIMKMVFFAHGFATLLPLGRPLVKGGFQAWQYGPVPPRAYRIFRSHITMGLFAKKPIEDPDIKKEEQRIREGSGLEEVEGVDGSDIVRLLNGVYERYHRMDPFKLSTETHEKGSPWDKTRAKNPGNYYAEFDDEDIAEYFKENHLLSEVFVRSASTTEEARSKV